MRSPYQKKNAATQLRRSAVRAIGNVLRGQYETVITTSMPPELRELITKLDQRQRADEATAAQKRK